MVSKYSIATIVRKVQSLYHQYWKVGILSLYLKYNFIKIKYESFDINATTISQRL